MFKSINLQFFAEDTTQNEKGDANLGNKPDNRETANKNPFDRLYTKLTGKSESKESETKEDKKPDETKNPDEKQEDKKPDEVKEPDTKEPEAKKVDGEFIPIKHLGKEIKIPAAERDKYLQMGYDYPHAKDELGKAKATLQRIAALEGKTVEEYITELDNREKAKLAEKIEEAAGDPDKIDEIVKSQPEVVRTKEERRKLDYANAKAELSKDEFFKELEPELDDLMEKNSTADPNLVYSVLVGNYVRSGKLNELKKRFADEAEKRVIADMHDKERRTVPKGGDTEKAQEVVQVSNSLGKLAGIFGLDKSRTQRAAQRAHERLKQK